MTQVGRPPKYKTPEEMQVIIDNYINERIENNEPLTVTGLAIALDMTREQIVYYEDNKNEFTDTIKKAKQVIQDYAEKQLFVGKNAAGVIFNLKNNYGWKDKTETELTGGNVSININRQAK